MPDDESRTVCIINGSLRGKKAASLAFSRDLKRRLPPAEFETVSIGVKARVKDCYPEATMLSIARADAIVLIFPLHNYGLPGALMRLLEEYYAYADIAQDILSGDEGIRKDYFIKPIIPEPIIAAIRRHYERSGKMIEG